ncbi:MULTISPECIES: hypothetical protein [Brevibacillus]|nr:MULTISPECIES: hypothetical protein [Brevibacillus]MBE5394926.1 hypothetical protein [Brevibacillus borstelensis]MCG5252940.1 hypothetical protein [Brevibacillus agri]MED1851666.1 hypothetical protein [Brevibacillus borstelensis]MED3501189.1 hypothetical protein [Brevibacillus agri]QAV16166.1 hypothetical protein BA6348_25200 [Brevibacillus agri]
MNIEILGEEDFKHYKAIRDGYFVIIDTTRRLIHTTGCSDVNISSFRVKVLENTGKNGRYYFTDDLVEGRETFRAEKCKNCRPK